MVGKGKNHIIRKEPSRVGERVGSVCGFHVRGPMSSAGLTRGSRMSHKRSLPWAPWPMLSALPTHVLSYNSSLNVVWGALGLSMFSYSVIYILITHTCIYLWLITFIFQINRVNLVSETWPVTCHPQIPHSNSAPKALPGQLLLLFLQAPTSSGRSL